MIKDFLIQILFKLLGNDIRATYKIPYLFGASSESGQDARKKRWERALSRLWTDKNLLDFLYYQAESDKENYWRGKIDKRLSQGARIRTLFIVYSAKRANRQLKLQRTKLTPDQRSEQNKEIKAESVVYKEAVDID